MAEFCLECFNRINDTQLSKWEIKTAVDLCEGCGDVKPCVIEIRDAEYRFNRVRYAADKRDRKNG